MTGEELKNILAHGEGVDTEFKESTHQLARKIYESICAFLNRRGGHVVLGALNPYEQSSTFQTYILSQF